ARDNQRAHRARPGHGIQNGRQASQDLAHERTGRMRDPAKVLSSEHLKTRRGEWRRILVQRRQVAFLLLVLTKAILERAAKGWETIAHVNVHADPARGQEAEDVPGTIQLSAGPVTVAKGVHPKDEVK